MYWCLGYDYIRCNNNYVALNLAKLHVFFRDFSNHGAGGLIMYIDIVLMPGTISRCNFVGVLEELGQAVCKDWQKGL